MTPYADALASARKARGVTLRQLAEIVGVSIPYLHDVEHARRPPMSGERNIKLATWLDLDLGELELLAVHARGQVDVTGLEPKDVGRVVRLVEKLRQLRRADR